ncbi:O-antigen polysaccharide polymerase Wzy [Vibrio fluvialis]|uniref:O-antigen polysaccharide polymerase Wzy n=1 Tax=Vibrio fluvialis TaxID=676 RepID=UPI0028E06120|nr:O-antigen polysaccharide polymerase Wzy [Vibrio fluvialis]MDT8869694.1 O-antigen polysaccharide polymerase Wzy family protein [Vibrio fluvialis]MDT8877464.1 O-antigen polysaccharide polymerase Wzy family protein [Vibrio fluvialis]
MSFFLFNVIQIVLYLSFLVSIYIEHAVSLSIVNVACWLTIISCAVYFYKLERRFVTPVTCYFLSFVIFIMSRPLLYPLVDEDIISIGDGVNDENIIVAICFSMLTFLIINILFKIFLTLGLKLSLLLPDIKVHDKNLSKLAIYMSIVLSLLFLYSSYKNYIILGNSANYFVFIDSLNSSYFKFFFFSKYLILIYLALSENKKSLLYSAILIFVASIGFMLIGLRGYTIAYFFLMLIAYDIYYKIKLRYLLLISIVVLLLSASVLSFRLGYDVFIDDGIVNIIAKTLFQQGASFEVVFGAVNFHQQLDHCISYLDYFSGISFGDCVDKVRGVTFEQGGFASSFFAEAIYFMPIYPIIIILFSFFLSFVQNCYSRLVKPEYFNKKHMFIIFFLTPNIVYFARSSSFDFIEKSFQSIVFIIVIFYILNSLKGKKIERT